MSSTASGTTPFTAFNFAVEIVREDGSSPLVSGSFSECDGLEMSMEVKTIREGGDNGRQIRLSGPASLGNLTLKRGLTASTDLWTWISDTLDNPSLRANAEVVVFAPDGVTERARFILTRCLPLKVKAPPLNAKDGLVAIEELQLAYESLRLKPPSDGGGLGLDVSVSVGGAGVTASAGISL
jgi:phage tail-like protein